MKRFSILLAVLLLGTNAAAREITWDARITKVKGGATVTLAGSDEEEAIKAKKDMPLSAGDVVRTGKKGRAEIAIKDDSLLELGPNSTFRVQSLKKDDTLFTLDVGYLVAKIKLMIRRRFVIKTPNSSAAVRGTEFGIEVVEDEDGEGSKTIVGVFDEGELVVTSLDDESGEERFITAKEEAEFISGEVPGEVHSMEFLERHSGRMKSVRGRRKALRRQFKKYSRASRARIRRTMNKARDRIRGKRKKMYQNRKGRREELLERRRQRRGGRRGGRE